MAQPLESPSPPQQLGVLGGTFNPPHLGHLALARCARAQLGLERVLLVPSCVPPHKRAAADPGPEHRLRMCELAIVGEPHLEASPLEVQRGGPSYTVDTLCALRSLHPNASLTLILGSDVARTLPEWHRPVEVAALARLAIAARAGEGHEVLGSLRSATSTITGSAEAAANGTPGEGAVLLEMPEVPISSSLVRARVAARESLDGLVPPAVAAYIVEHALYARPVEAHAR
jgi:nicotinate-nucleotide adenylyltransferase